MTQRSDTEVIQKWCRSDILVMFDLVLIINKDFLSYYFLGISDEFYDWIKDYTRSSLTNRQDFSRQIQPIILETQFISGVGG